MSQITNLVFCQFASIHFDSQTRQLLTRARNTSTAVQWSLQKYFFTCIINSSPFHIPDNTAWRNTPCPTEGQWLQRKQEFEHTSPNLCSSTTFPSLVISQQILSPPHPPAPCYLLAAFVPNRLHERLMGSNSREIVLLKTCHFPQKMLSEVLKMLLSISCSFYSNNRNSLLPSHALVSWRKFK